jgi:hypothetical protein
MVQAAVDAAEGHLREARKRLSTLQPMLARSGMVLAELERRLLLLQIDHAGGRPRVQPDVSALEKDARVRGAGLIVRRVQSL